MPDAFIEVALHPLVVPATIALLEFARKQIKDLLAEYGGGSGRVITTSDPLFASEYHAALPHIVKCYVSTYERLLQLDESRRKREDPQNFKAEADDFEVPDSYVKTLRTITAASSDQFEIDMIFVLFEVHGEVIGYIQGSFDRRAKIFYLWYLCSMNRNPSRRQLDRYLLHVPTDNPRIPLYTKLLVHELVNHLTTGRDCRLIVYEVDHRFSNPRLVSRLKLFTKIERALRLDLVDLHHRNRDRHALINKYDFRNFLCDFDYVCPPYGADGSGISDHMHLVVIPLSHVDGNSFGVGQVPANEIRPIMESVYRMYLESHPHPNPRALELKRAKVRELVRAFTRQYTGDIRTPLLADAISQINLSKRVKAAALGGSQE